MSASLNLIWRRRSAPSRALSAAGAVAAIATAVLLARWSRRPVNGAKRKLGPRARLCAASTVAFGPPGPNHRVALQRGNQPGWVAVTAF